MERFEFKKTMCNDSPRAPTSKQKRNECKYQWKRNSQKENFISMLTAQLPLNKTKYKYRIKSMENSMSSEQRW